MTEMLRLEDGHFIGRKVDSNDVTYGGTIESTVFYPECQRNTLEHGYAHDFQGYEDGRGAPPLLFCRRCGQVRKLEYVP